jgi:hypothetical protein
MQIISNQLSDCVALTQKFLMKGYNYFKGKKNVKSMKGLYCPNPSF